MKSLKDILLLLVVLIGAAAAGMWVLKMDAQVTPAQEDVALEEDSGAKKPPILYRPNREGVGMHSTGAMEVRKQFERIVNGFLQDLNVRMNQYRKKRQTLRDIIKPQNMRVYQYVPENDNVARKLMAELEAESDVVINQFEETDKEMRALLQSMNPDDSSSLLREWDVANKEQLSEYKRFFAEESRLHDLYRVILEVYAESRGAYQVELDVGKKDSSVNFKDQQLQSTYDAANRGIEEVMDNRGALK